MSNKLVLVDQDSPVRCQRIDKLKGDQCSYASQPGEQFCSKHLNSIQHRRRTLSRLNYKFASYQTQASLTNQASRSDIKNLNEELAITRICIQTLANLCQVDEDISLYTPQLTLLLSLCNDIVLTVHKIEITTTLLVDKSQLIDVAEGLLNLAEHPHGPLSSAEALDLTDDLLEIISSRMGAGSKLPPRTALGAEGMVGGDQEGELASPVHYRLKHWDHHLKAYYSHPQITDLRSELAVARVILEATLNTCPTPATLLHNLAKIVNALSLVKRLVITIHGIDHQSGNLLDRNDVLEVASKMAERVSRAIPDQYLPKMVLALQALFSNLLPDDSNDADLLKPRNLAYNDPDDSPAVVPNNRYVEDGKAFDPDSLTTLFTDDPQDSDQY